MVDIGEGGLYITILCFLVDGVIWERNCVWVLLIDLVGWEWWDICIFVLIMVGRIVVGVAHDVKIDFALLHQVVLYITILNNTIYLLK